MQNSDNNNLTNKKAYINVKSGRNGFNIGVKLIGDEYQPVDDIQSLQDFIARFTNKSIVKKRVEQDTNVNNIKLDNIQNPQEVSDGIDNYVVPTDNIEKTVNNDNDKLNSINNIIDSQNEIKFITGYRDSNIEYGCITGNYFLLEPHGVYDKKFVVKYEPNKIYEISDEKIMEYENPLYCILKQWFIAEEIQVLYKYFSKEGLSHDEIIGAMIAKKAKVMKYDLIKYGNKLIQVII